MAFLVVLSSSGVVVVTTTKRLFASGFSSRFGGRGGSSCLSSRNSGAANKRYHRRYGSSESAITTRQLSTAGNAEYGRGMDQEAMMESDLLVAVDEHDVVVPGAGVSKRRGHAFSAKTPRGTLHRAFSLFLFRPDGRMLLTRRASSKITFPNVWTNTCCSHPLHNMEPDEVDAVPDAYPSFPGIKSAAVRKVRHELGIDPSYVRQSEIQFLTRFHYWAADTVTYGRDATPWGEHEIDYILFYRTSEDDGDVPVDPNPEEVSEYKFVTSDELKSMMARRDLLWSPWFRGIMDRGGWDWWADLEGSLNGEYTNDRIHFFDPPPEHSAAFNLPSHGRETGVLKSTAAT